MADAHASSIESALPAAIQELQLDLMRRQLGYLRQRSPFHRRKLAAAGWSDRSLRSLDDLRTIPFTTKDEIRASLLREAPLGEHCAADPRTLVQFHCSSGTTGRPSYVGLTETDLSDWIEMQRRSLWGIGVRPGDRVLQAFGMSRGWVGGVPIVQALQALGAGVIPAGAEPGATWLLNVIRDLQPNVLVATPNFAAYLAERAGSVLGIDADQLHIRKLGVGGEPGGGIPSFRTRVERAWNASMREVMGGGDVCPVLWGECEEGSGMHFMAPDSVHVEIVSLDDQSPLPVERGVVGEVVYTHLRREATPVLRFRYADIVEVIDTTCTCGRTTPKIRCVGRTDDLLIVKGVNLYPTAIQDIVETFRPLTSGSVKVVKESSGYVTAGPVKIKVERGRGLVDGQEETLIRHIELAVHDLCRCRAAVSLVPLGTFPEPGREKVSLIERAYAPSESPQ